MAQHLPLAEVLTGIQIIFVYVTTFFFRYLG